MLNDENINVALLQETILPQQRPILITGYTAYRCSFSIKCQGIMILIRNDTQVEFENIPSGDIDIQRTTARINNSKYVFYNAYWPNHFFVQNCLLMKQHTKEQYEQVI